MLENKNLKFKPNIKKSMKTLDNTIMGARQKSPINTIKGVQAHIDKIKMA